MSKYVDVIWPMPSARRFTYIWPEDWPEACFGQLIKIEVGQKQRLAWVVSPTMSAPPNITLKPVLALIDTRPIWSLEMQTFIQFASDYYHYPLAQVMATSIPPTYLSHYPLPIWWQSWFYPDTNDLKTPYCCVDLMYQGWHSHKIKRFAEEYCPPAIIPKAHLTLGPDYSLSTSQQNTLQTISQHLDQFYVALLQGDPGCGKTEVFFQVMVHILTKQQQVLLMVPEISLCPQMQQRINQRFPYARVVVLHSGLTTKQRLMAWSAASHADIVLGTRSSIWIPLPRLGLIVVDEVHDPSYKQQEQFRFSARDLALKRAKINHIPIILCSATPSLNLIWQAQSGNYQLFSLSSHKPLAEKQLRIIDRSKANADSWIEPICLAQIKTILQAGQQVLIFINRRGFAPVIWCPACHTSYECPHCSHAMILHRHPKATLICHFCTYTIPEPERCLTCQGQLIPIGYGTEKIAADITNWFPQYRSLRVDRDSISSKQWPKVYQQIVSQQIQLIIGTQWLGKGHHFPGLAMVLIVDMDGGLLATDFHASETMGSLLWQVAGRAGRENTAGTIWLQTKYPKHPLLNCLLAKGYMAFAELLMAERKLGKWPPFSAIAALYLSSKHQQEIEHFAGQIAVWGNQHLPKVELLGPIPTRIWRKKSQFYWQIILKSDSRTSLHTAIKRLKYYLDSQKLHRAHYVIDIDPYDLSE